MHTSIIAMAFAFAASLVSAQEPYYNISSKPFSLVIHSKNKTLDNTALFACHEGAAIEGLCVSSSKPSKSTKQFHFNTTVYDKTGNGIVTWILKGGNFQVSSGLTISPNLITNVAIPLFFPGDTNAAIVRFDKSNKLAIRGYSDDTVVPLNRNKQKDYYRWYVCNTYYGYEYHTLTWVVGEAKPQNPTCQKVDVVRVY